MQRIDDAELEALNQTTCGILFQHSCPGAACQACARKIC